MSCPELCCTTFPAKENSFRPEGVAPSQGGKYVGFGSAPGPSASASGRGNSKGVDEVTSLFSQGWNQLSSVAEAAAKTAAGAVKRCEESDLGDQSRSMALCRVTQLLSGV